LNWVGNRRGEEGGGGGRFIKFRKRFQSLFSKKEKNEKRGNHRRGKASSMDATTEHPSQHEGGDRGLTRLNKEKSLERRENEPAGGMFPGQHKRVNLFKSRKKKGGKSA